MNAASIILILVIVLLLVAVGLEIYELIRRTAAIPVVIKYIKIGVVVVSLIMVLVAFFMAKGLVKPVPVALPII